MANMTLPHVWGVQRPQITRPERHCHAGLSDSSELGCRKHVSGTSKALLRSSAHKAGRQLVSAVASAPAAQSTSRLLVDLAVASLPLNFGANVRIVGDCVELGGWDVDAAPQFNWADGDEWNKQLELPSGEHEFKLVICDPNEDVIWEQGENRKTEVPAPEPGVQTRLELRCQFGETADTIAKAQPKAAPAKPAQPKGKSPVPRQNSSAARPAAPAQATATEAPPKGDPSLKEIQKTQEDDGSITFSFPKGYRFRGGIEDTPVEDDAEAGEQQVTDEYESGEIVDVQEDPETKKQRDEMVASYKPIYGDSEISGMDDAYGKAMGGQEAGAFDMNELGKGAEESGGWTMDDEFDAPQEEYGEDRPDADKDDAKDMEDWSKEGAGSAIDYSDPGDFDFSDE